MINSRTIPLLFKTLKIVIDKFPSPVRSNSLDFCPVSCVVGAQEGPCCCVVCHRVFEVGASEGTICRVLVQAASNGWVVFTDANLDS
jgi:hypothetical protein